MLPHAGGPVGVGLCRDSAPRNSTPMRGSEGGGGGGRDGEAFWLEVFFIFFNRYINMLKVLCNLYLHQADVSSTRNWM